jgi:hypothetical protein
VVRRPAEAQVLSISDLRKRKAAMAAARPLGAAKTPRVDTKATVALTGESNAASGDLQPAVRGRNVRNGATSDMAQPVQQAQPRQSDEADPFDSAPPEWQPDRSPARVGTSEQRPKSGGSAQSGGGVRGTPGSRPQSGAGASSKLSTEPGVHPVRPGSQRARSSILCCSCWHMSFAEVCGAMQVLSAHDGDRCAVISHAVTYHLQGLAMDVASVVLKCVR